MECAAAHAFDSIVPGTPLCVSAFLSKNPPTSKISKHTMATSSPPNQIIICGGGVIGASTAYFLSQSTKSPKITLLEKSSVACAASGKAGGFLALDWCDSSPSLSSLARFSFLLHRTLSQSLDGPRNYGYRPLTTLSISCPPAPPSSSSSKSRSSSLPSWIDGPVGSSRTIGTVDTTAQVHPKLFTQTLIDATKERNGGFEVVIGEMVEVAVEGGKVTGVVTREGGFIGGDAVVLALGPWSSKAQILNSVFRVLGTKAHSIVVRPSEAAEITPHALFLSYQDSPGGKMLDPEVYPRPTGEVYICGMSSEAEVPNIPEEIVSDRNSIKMLHKIAGKVSSHLSKDNGAEVLAEQACFLPCSDDGLPVIGEIPGVKGCYVATGHSCWGILNGPATGASLAELILDGKPTTVDLMPFSPLRFLSHHPR